MADKLTYNKEVNAFIGVGSNINPERNISDALTRLSAHVDITGISTFYQTGPILWENQDDYLNGVWQVLTLMSPQELKVNVLNAIEKGLQRIKTSDKYGARTIDLDLLLFGDFVINEEGLKVPDPDIYKRSFVAFPLSELDSDLIIPDTNTPLATILNSLSRDNLRPDIPFTESLKRELHNIITTRTL